MNAIGHLTEDQRARMAWARIAEPDDHTARAMIAERGVVEALEMARAGTSGRPRASAERFAARLKDLNVERDLEISAKVGALILFPTDEHWPDGVEGLDYVPWCLWVKGRDSVSLGSLCERSAAIVGARASTSYGEYVASELAAGLASREFTVISGAAFGIDAAAHRGALACDGDTIAVLAGGVERPYPAAHASLLARICEVGAVVSEVPPGSAPTRSRFLARNRLIAAMSGGTIIVEAGLRSGSRSTVTHATKLLRPIGAVPGPITSMASAGCHEEIRAGRASLVTDAAEVAELFGRIGDDLAPHKQGALKPSDDLDPDTFRVWQAMATRRSITVDALTQVAGLSVADVMGALGQLEAAQLARRSAQGWMRCTP